MERKKRIRNREFIGLFMTPEDAGIIRRLSQDASDLAGWTISASAILRGLIRFADRQGPQWARKHLQAIVEEETRRGFTWGGSRKGAGRKKKKGANE